MNENIYVFVYGSLRTRCYNHPRLLDCKYLGTFPLKGFKLYRVCASYPGAIYTKDDNDIITVEMYKIDSEKLAELDILEGHPYSYERIQVNINDVTGWIYCIRDAEKSNIENRYPLIGHGDWIRYRYPKNDDI